MDQKHRMLDARIPQGQGYSQVQIAEMLHVIGRTVRNYLKNMPQESKRPVRGSKVDPHKPLIDEVLDAIATCRCMCFAGINFCRPN
jgi:predicted transcriptional regulator